MNSIYKKLSIQLITVVIYLFLGVHGWAWDQDSAKSVIDNGVHQKLREYAETL
jgi:hypothetical protein